MPGSKCGDIVMKDILHCLAELGESDQDPLTHAIPDLLARAGKFGGMQPSRDEEVEGPGTG